MKFLFCSLRLNDCILTHISFCNLCIFINCTLSPSVVKGTQIFILDLAAKIDQCAEFLCKAKWGDVDFPPPFGRDALPEVCI